MEKEFIDKYEKLLNKEDYFSINKEDLQNLVDEKNVESNESYKLLSKLGGVESLLDRLDVLPDTGLCDYGVDSSHFAERRRLFGENTPMKPFRNTFLQAFTNALKDKIIIFLLFAATVRLVIDIIEKKGRWFDYCSIYILVTVISFIVAVTNYSKDKVFSNFQMEIEDKEVRVLRNQIEKLIHKEDLVVGDILIINAGDILPIDGIILKAYSISFDFENKIYKYHNINYKSLSTQSTNFKVLADRKADDFPIILSGSKIVRGYAYVLVLAVGENTHLNKVNFSKYRMRRASLSTVKDKDENEIENKEKEANGGEVVIDFKKKYSGDSSQHRSKGNANEEDQSAHNSLMTPTLERKKNQSLNQAIKTSNSTPNVNHKNPYKGNNNIINISDENFMEVEKEVMQNKKAQARKTVYQKHDEQSSYTPLQVKLQAVSGYLSKFGIIASIIAFSFFIITFYTIPDHFIKNSELIQVIFDAIIYGIIIIVVAVPGSLPLVVTLTIAFSLNKMREEKAVIKNLEACENMACVDCICTDFTGIITKNDMKITQIYIEDQLLEGRNVSNLREHISRDFFDFFCEGVAVNTIAFAAEKDMTVDYFGDPIERSLIRYLKHINVGYSLLRNNLLRPIIDSSSYSPDNKISFTIIEMDEKKDYVRIYVKGSPDILLDLISIYITDGLMKENINPRQYEKIRMKSINIMKEGNIPLMFCYRDYPRDQYNQTRHAYLHKDTEFMNTIIRQLTFICLVGMKDELREGVEKDIYDCQRAGIVVRMITSQSKECATIAAEQCGIIKPPKSVHQQNVIKTRSLDGESMLNGRDKRTSASVYSSLINIQINGQEIIDAQEDLRKFVEIQYLKKSVASFSSFEFTLADANRFYKKVENALVISRAQTKDKFVFVASLKQKGYTVAITGDGVSDSLAMKTAHVGISMGYRSSDMSKEAADVILTDDNFKSIITAIVYGRNIFDSVRKFLQFQITATISVIALVVVSVLPVVNFYVYPNQLLWIYLILHTITPICLSSEHPDREDILSKKPYSLKKSIFTKDMITKIAVQSTLQIVLLVSLIFFGAKLFHVSDDLGLNYREWEESNGIHTSIVFNCIIYMQFFNAFISRTLDKKDMNIFRNLSNNRVFIIVEPLIIIFQLLIISHGGRMTRTRSLDMSTHAWCFIIASLTLFTLPIVKYLPFSFSFDDRENSDPNDEEKKK